MKVNSYHSSGRKPGWQASESQLLPPAAGCPVCGCTTRAPVVTVQRDPNISLLFCPKCRLCSTSRMPTDDALREYYAHFYDDWEGPSTSQITIDEPIRLARHIARAVRGVSETVRIVDFGGGDATIARMIAELLISRGQCRKANISLIEWSTAQPSAPANIQIEVMEKIPDQPGTFDLAIASAILEHLPQPREPLQALLKCLKPGGVFYARTPYVVPLIRLVPPLRDALFPFPTHLHDMGQHFWNNVLTTLDLADKYLLSSSTPSIVELNWKHHLPQWLAANCLKAPWYVLRGSYGLVGGWEVFVRAK